MVMSCCAACPSGTFGKDCASTCPCQNGAACDKVNGTCYCSTIQGYTGLTCGTGESRVAEVSCAPDHFETYLVYCAAFNMTKLTGLIHVTCMLQETQAIHWYVKLYWSVGRLALIHLLRGIGIIWKYDPCKVEVQ